MKKIIFITIVLIFIISIVFFLKTEIPTDKKVLTVINVPLINCQVQKQSCKSELDELKLKISFDKDIYYLKPFNFSVRTKKTGNNDIDSIKINFKMKNMDMGINQFSLKKLNTENKEQLWQGTALLPICVTGRADWFSELEIVTKNSKHIVSFPITVKQVKN